MNITEMRAKIEALKVEVRTLLTSDVNSAEVKMEEVRNLEKSLKLQVELGEAEEREILDQNKNKKDGDDKMEKVNEMRSIVKHVIGETLTTEERAQITTLENGAVLPKQFINQLIEIQKGYGSLKYLCDVIPVTKAEGTMPVVDLDQNDLLDVLEGADIVEGELVTTDITFKCVKVGLIQTLTSELLADAEVEIEGLVRKNFTNIATVKENAKILAVIKNNATVVVATGYEDIDKTIDSALPSVKAGLSTITNVSGYVYLKNLKDLTTGRKLDLVTMVNGVEVYNSKPLVVVEDAMLPATVDKKVFYVCNTKEAIKFFDREAVTVATSVEAGFKNDTKKVRILERFDVAKGSVRSIKKIEF
jgi:HK97 family phage major capsid protein